MPRDDDGLPEPDVPLVLLDDPVLPEPVDDMSSPVLPDMLPPLVPVPPWLPPTLLDDVPDCEPYCDEEDVDGDELVVLSRCAFAIVLSLLPLGVLDVACVVRSSPAFEQPPSARAATTARAKILEFIRVSP